MEHVGATYGCGRAMWEYEPNESRFGSTMALMLLPYWSNGCIGSMEGLLFESSTTTPYHFINQSELSVQPSDPQANLDYSVGPNVILGVQHLQLLGVRYYMASDPGLQAQAAADPSLRLIAKTGPWTTGPLGGPTITTTWKIYQVLDSPLVAPLRFEPAVERGIGAGQSSWLRPAEQWYNQPSRWGVELAQSGPASWPRVPIGDSNPPRRRVASTRVSSVSISDDQVRFHVSRVGVPVLVKVSYFPNWHVAGASGPYRVTPNLMVVVPTAHDVVLTYGMSPAEWTGDLLTLGGLVLLAVGGVAAMLRPRRRLSAGGVGSVGVVSVAAPAPPPPAGGFGGPADAAGGGGAGGASGADGLPKPVREWQPPTWSPPDAARDSEPDSGSEEGWQEP
jgi:hypothetical protein